MQLDTKLYEQYDLNLVRQMIKRTDEGNIPKG